MSNRLLRAVRPLNLGNSTAKLVLMVLADHADDKTFETFVGQKTIAGEANVGIASVKRSMKLLRDRGLVTTLARYEGGHRKEDCIRLTVIPMEGVQEDHGDPDAGSLGSNQGGHRDQSEPAYIAEASDEASEREHTQPEEPKKPQRAKRGHRLPDDWTPSLRDRLWATAVFEITDEQVQHEADKFRAYWHSMPDPKGRKLDWSLTWQNWLYNCKPALPKRKITPREPKGEIAPETYRNALKVYRSSQFWDRAGLGPAPDEPNCRAPATLLAEFGFAARPPPGNGHKPAERRPTLFDVVPTPTH